MIKTCVFDLDGTLIDSIEDLAISTNKVLQKRNLKTHDLDIYKQFVGNGVKTLISKALGEKHQDCLSECVDEFFCIYENNCFEKTKIYDGISELLDSLYSHNIVIGIVTNKPHTIAVKIVEELFGNKITYVYGQQDNFPKKPDPYFIAQILSDLDISKEECLYIGDSDVDIETGKNAGVKTIGVSWGFRGRAELTKAGADYIVDYPFEIGDIVYENRS